jgi:hypothetical protein
VRFSHFPIVGLCPACAAEQPAEGATAEPGRAHEHRHTHPHRH